MPTHTEKLTDKVARLMAPPAEGQAIHWCPKTPGFGLRLTKTGDRAWVSERRVDGKTVRRTLGKAQGPAAITAETARRLQLDVSSELQRGVDRLEVKRERIEADKAEGLTLAMALAIYVDKKRRAKDGLPLKDRTKADYLAMVEPAGVVKGKPTMPGALFPLAAKSIHRISADDVTGLHTSLAARGERQQTYAMQVLRAVLRYFGVQIVDNPLAPTTAGAERIHLKASKGDPSPIPAERLGAWWRAACKLQGASADQLRFMLLTGARPAEAAAVQAGQVDVPTRRLTLVDTKNRSDHLVMMSEQVAAIVSWTADGKKPGAPVFGVGDTRAALRRINAEAGTPHVTPNKLRHTFASVAEGLVSTYVMKRMINHSNTGDVTGEHYINVGSARLKAGWQAVADFIEAAD